MPRLFRACSVLVCLVAAVIAVACGGGDSSSAGTPSASKSSTAAFSTTGAGFPFTFTDSSGTAVSFTSAPQRIISYSPAATEVLYAVGAGPQVVGADKFSDYPAEVKPLAKLDYSDPAPEPAIALKPELVIMASQQEAQLTRFRSLGMKVVLLREPADLAGVLQQIRTIGRITGHADAAERITGDMQRRIDAVAAHVARATQTTSVFYELSPDGFSASPNSFVGSLFTVLKVRNVVKDTTTAFPQLSAEAIIAANPQVILLADADEANQSLQTVRARPGWNVIAAVSSGRVYPVDANVLTRPGPRIVDGLEQLEKILYPGSQ